MKKAQNIIRILAIRRVVVDMAALKFALLIRGGANKCASHNAKRSWILNPLSDITRLKEMEISNLNVFLDLYELHVDLWLAILDGF
jgi:hypothetical protein